MVGLVYLRPARLARLRGAARKVNIILRNALCSLLQGRCYRSA